MNSKQATQATRLRDKRGEERRAEAACLNRDQIIQETQLRHEPDEELIAKAGSDEVFNGSDFLNDRFTSELRWLHANGDYARPYAPTLSVYFDHVAVLWSLLIPHAQVGGLACPDELYSELVHTFP
jgi:hypothetical protein